MSIFTIIFVVLGPFLLWRMFRDPFIGLLAMLAINPVEALIPLPAGLSAGRIVGFLTVGAWVVRLIRDPESVRRLKESRLARRIWVFPAIGFLGVYLGDFDRFNQAGLSEAIKVTLLAVMAMMIENLCSGRRNARQLMLVVMLSSVVASIFPLAYQLGFDLYGAVGFDADQAAGGSDRVRGLANNANALGIATSMGLYAVLVYASVQRSLVGLVTLTVVAMVVVGGLFLSGSRTHLLASGICLGVFFSARLWGPGEGRILAVVAILGILALAPFAYRLVPENVQKRLVVVGDNVDDRTLYRAEFTRWQRQQALDALKENPVLGLGFMGFTLSPRGDGFVAHDTFSSLVGETGLAGTSALLWLLASGARWLHGGMRRGRSLGDGELYSYGLGFLATLAAILAASLGGYILYYQRWFWITTGMAAVILRWTAEHKQIPAPAVVSRAAGRKGKYVQPGWRCPTACVVMTGWMRTRERIRTTSAAGRRGGSAGKTGGGA